jgi:lipoprotein NlpI
MTRYALLLIWGWLVCTPVRADEIDDLLQIAKKALTARDHVKVYDATSAVLKLHPKSADAYYLRAQAEFKRNRVKESVADFEKLLEIKPDVRPELWQYGIALYYVERAEDGAKLFSDHQKVNPQDVENAFWHFLCTAKATKDVAKARAGLIAVTQDRRVPMKEIQLLLADQAKPDDVLKAAKKADPANTPLFYAHLYLGLYYEAVGEAAKSLEHIRTAVEKHQVPDYMWDVGNIHLQLRSKK